MTSKGTVRVENLVKEFGSVMAVDDVSFEIEDGEFFSLLGPSGCGKTTTLRCIAGFEMPSSGSVYIDGVEMTDVPTYKRDTGMVFQNYALFPHKTVGENVGFGLKMQGVPKEERADRVAEALELVDLPGYEDRLPDELSGGQQQRVALARAIVIEPSVLLLDEPLSNLDLKLRKQMRFELQNIQSELGITTIYVTHDQEEALSMSDRILVMNDGEAMQIGPPTDIYNNPTNEFVADFIGEANFFEGTINERTNGEVEVELSELNRRLVTNSMSDPGIERGEEILVNVRPEDIAISTESASAEGVTGEITGKTFLGKATRFLISVNGNEVLVELTGLKAQQQFDVGDTVTIEWTEDDSLVIPKYEQ